MISSPNGAVEPLTLSGELCTYPFEAVAQTAEMPKGMFTAVMQHCHKMWTRERGDTTPGDAVLQDRVLSFSLSLSPSLSHSYRYCVSTRTDVHKHACANGLVKVHAHASRAHASNRVCLGRHA